MVSSVANVPTVITIEDPASGLRAHVAIDSLVDGRAAGGIRTASYANSQLAIQEAMALAQAMTVKCRQAALPCGGCKIVVEADQLRDRRAAFVYLGQALAELGGAVNTAGDIGTTESDLAAVASVCDYVHINVVEIAAATAQSVWESIRACCDLLNLPVATITMWVQGVGTIGAAVVEAMCTGGAKNIFLSDIDGARASQVAAQHQIPKTRIEANCSEPQEHIQLWSPCAKGGVVTPELAARLDVKAICGGANNVLVDGALAVLQSRGILFVPDVISSCGGVVYGIASGVLGESDAQVALRLAAVYERAKNSIRGMSING